MKKLLFLILAFKLFSLNTTQADIVDVDTELLLLVDISTSVDPTEYSTMMDGYEAAFRSSQTVDAIQAGQLGKIAVSLHFWSTTQQLGVDWFEISDSASANSFADSIAALSRPFSGSTRMDEALIYGTDLFGTETGGSDNGFNSTLQVMDVSGDGRNSGGIHSDVTDASAAAIATGVDMINGLTIGMDYPQSTLDEYGLPRLDEYYEQYLIADNGNLGPDSYAFVMHANSFEDVEEILTLKLVNEINGVPEPSTYALIAGFATLLFVVTRRRK